MSDPDTISQILGQVYTSLLLPAAVLLVLVLGAASLLGPASLLRLSDAGTPRPAAPTEVERAATLPQHRLKVFVHPLKVSITPTPTQESQAL